MKKYVRTKDGRILENLHNITEHSVRTKDGELWGDEIVATADSIEELCDRYYIDDEGIKVEA